MNGAVREPPLHIDTTGDLVLHTADSEIRFHQPRLYQDINGTKQAGSGRYVLLDAKTPNSELRTQEVGFAVAAYDTSKPLIIDPVLVYSTYLGGSNDDRGNAIAVDAFGNAYMTGSTYSLDFPTTAGTVQPSCNSSTGCARAFVAKLNATVSALIYATYLGGSISESGTGIAVDAAGNAYVTGLTKSRDFPTTAGAFQPACHTDSAGFCEEDAFVVKLNSTGSALNYATYLGGSSLESGFFFPGPTIAVDAAGNAYVMGTTTSLDFPTTTGAFQQSCGTDGFGRCRDAFITKLNSAGSSLIYSTYLGGSDVDEGRGIAVDSAGNVYVAGRTFSNDFPTRAGAFQRACHMNESDQCSAAFIAKLDLTKLAPLTSALVYSTYLGGIRNTEANAIAVDGAGNAYVTGGTDSDDFPTTTGALLTTPTPGFLSGFLTKLNPTGSALVYSTYFDQVGRSIATDRAGNTYLAGTASSNCGGSFGIFSCFNTAYITKVNAAGTSLSYSLPLDSSRGDPTYDFFYHIAVDTEGNVYVTSSAFSDGFPITAGAFQNTRSGYRDAFIAKIADRPAGIVAFFESPENGPVFGITVIRGWAFATEPDVSISSVELFIDGQSAGEVPCCSARGDVQAAFPQFPADNTLNSGWGTVFNWGLASAGTHTVRLFIRSTSGELFVTDTRTVTVVKPGDSEYLDQFDLSAATASITGDALEVDGIVVRDKASQQLKTINTRFRWFESAQGLGIVAASN